MQLIHFIFVPAIVWSAGVWLAASGPLLPVPLSIRAAAAATLPAWLSTWCEFRAVVKAAWVVNERRSELTSAAATSCLCRLNEAVQFNAAFFVVLAYSLFYTSLEPVAGLSWSALVGLPLWLAASAFQAQVAKAGLWALGLHVFGWYMQVGGAAAAAHRLQLQRSHGADDLCVSLALPTLSCSDSPWSRHPGGQEACTAGQPGAGGFFLRPTSSPSAVGLCGDPLTPCRAPYLAPCL